jgi:asparagine synthase (glutamine-hydrolysing)
MCGILALLNCDALTTRGTSSYRKALEAGQCRGPDETKVNCVQDVELVFHRLSINGLDNGSGQPMKYNGISWICNGEIYNHKELWQAIGKAPLTGSDCEVIGPLFEAFGMQQTLRMLDGVFSLVLHSFNNDTEYPDEVYIARDPLGVRPLFMGKCDFAANGKLAFASEAKVLVALDCLPSTILPFPPGTFYKYTKSFTPNSRWTLGQMPKVYHSFNVSPSTLVVPHVDQNSCLSGVVPGIYSSFIQSIKKRVANTDREIACLLSGGLDSSLVSAVVQSLSSTPIHTYSIGMPGSQDLVNARIVANHIGSNHHEIVISKEEFLNAICEVIKCIESYDITTVRASVGNYLIGREIAASSNAKVIFNGDGSDEVTGGYIYFLEAPSDLEFDCECRRLLEDIHLYDVLRSDRCISDHGLETRTPFLDRSFVQNYLDVPAFIRNPRSKDAADIWSSAESIYRDTGNTMVAEAIHRRPEKLLLRYTIQTMNPDLLPAQVLWRGKEAFSDGVSGNEPWHEIIKQKLRAPAFSDLYGQGLKGETPEETYYRVLFEAHYQECTHLIPYRWMPKWVDTEDPSARTIKSYTAR